MHMYHALSYITMQYHANIVSSMYQYCVCVAGTVGAGSAGR